MDLQVIQNKIFEIRGYRVMLDSDLAALYQIETKRLKEAVRRNLKRFPSPDFMFELTKEEWDFLRSQFATSKGGNRYPPFAFSEYGVTMLSSVLNSDIAIDINIMIVRAFVRLRELTTGYAELKRQLEQFQLDTTMQIAEIMDIINELSSQHKELDKPRKRIGFKN